MTTDPWLPQLEEAQRAYKNAKDSNGAKCTARALADRIAVAPFKPGRGYRAHYNLACYWTRVEKWDEALRELRLALESGDVAGMAQADAALAALKANRADAWGKLFAASPRPLAAFLPIGPDAAKALYDSYGIDGPRDFVSRSHTDAQRQDIAGKLVVSPEAVKEWHNVLKMGTKLELDLSMMNLLSAVRINSLSDLKSWEGREAELSKVLTQANAAGSFVDIAPSADDVTGWLNTPRG
jgi:hypothetical protein